MKRAFRWKLRFGHFVRSAGLTSGKAILVIWLCDCRCLRVEGDPVCGTMQVLPDRRHRQLGVLFCPARKSGGASSCQSITQSGQAGAAKQHEIQPQLKVRTPASGCHSLISRT
ncbi:MAG: hypothetical protein GDA36_01900 [Rhodobacteraceae bacterium]|nr:hypothetical protein [Paracoccaceae bacterium]